MCKHAVKRSSTAGRSKSATKKLSRKQIEYFFKRFEHWATQLRLNFSVSRIVDGSPGDALAWVDASWDAGCATVAIAGEWPADTAITNEELDRTALHEAIHLLLWPLDFYRRQPHTNEQWNAVEHAAIRAIERIIAPE